MELHIKSYPLLSNFLMMITPIVLIKYKLLLDNVLLKVIFY